MRGEERRGEEKRREERRGEEERREERRGEEERRLEEGKGGSHQDSSLKKTKKEVGSKF